MVCTEKPPYEQIKLKFPSRRIQLHARTPNKGNFSNSKTYSTNYSQKLLFSLNSPGSAASPPNKSSSALLVQFDLFSTRNTFPPL